jgi:hypothetical protein
MSWPRYTDGFSDVPADPTPGNVQVHWGTFRMRPGTTGGWAGKKEKQMGIIEQKAVARILGNRYSIARASNTASQIRHCLETELVRPGPRWDLKSRERTRCSRPMDMISCLGHSGTSGLWKPLLPHRQAKCKGRHQGYAARMALGNCLQAAAC